MKITCGTDIIEIERIKQTMEDMEQAFKDRVFTEAEIQYCESRKNKNINIMQEDLQPKKRYLKQYLQN